MCGFEPDTKGAVATNPLFARSVEEWERAARSWVEYPDRDRGLLLLSVVVESDPVWGETAVADHLAEVFARTPDRERMLQQAGRRRAAGAPADGLPPQPRPPLGRRAQGCARHQAAGGWFPIEALARWSGLAARRDRGLDARAPEGFARGGHAEPDDVAILRDAFELFSALRMEHQVEQLRAGEEPDDLIDPKSLPPLTRTSLKEAFRAVARVQRGVALRARLPGTLTRRWNPSWREARFIVIDVETTGLDPGRDEVISFAGIPIESARIIASESVHGLVRPRATAPSASVAIHRLREADLAGAPRAPEALAPLAALDARADPGGACQLGGAHVPRQGRVPTAAPDRGHGGPVAGAEHRARRARSGHLQPLRDRRGARTSRASPASRPRATPSPPRRPSSPWPLISKPAATGPCARSRERAGTLRGWQLWHGPGGLRSG